MLSSIKKTSAVALVAFPVLFGIGDSLSIPNVALSSDSLRHTDHIGQKSTNDPSHSHTNQTSRLAILAYHEDFCCINKPSGMSVYRNKNTRHGEKVVVSALKRQLSRKVLPIHRLDHRTSGALVLAFNTTKQSSRSHGSNVRNTPGMLHEALREANKTYVALVRGDWDHRFPALGTVIVDRPLLHRTTSNNETSTGANFQSACTIFTKIASFTAASKDNTMTYSCTLVAAQPIRSGRTHQIRRHAARDLAMPILGDTQHGDARVNRWWRHRMLMLDPIRKKHGNNNNNNNRMWLHCWKIEGLLRGDRNSTAIVAPLPSEFKGMLMAMKNEESSPTLYETALSVDPSLGMDWRDLRSGTLGQPKAWHAVQDG